MSRITITHLARNLADIVNRVAYRGEHFTVVRGKRPVVDLVPIPRGRRLEELPGLLASLPRLASGDADEMADELDRARRALGSSSAADPWQS